MNAKKAKEIICAKYKGKKIIECLEFNGFFAFGLADDGFDKKKDGMGGAYFTVGKTDGNIGAFNPISDIEALLSAKKIDVSDL